MTHGPLFFFLTAESQFAWSAANLLDSIKSAMIHYSLLVFAPMVFVLYFDADNILNQIYNTTRKWPDFCMTWRGRTIYLRYIAQLLTKNPWCTVSNVSTALSSNLIGQNAFLGPMRLPRG